MKVPLPKGEYIKRIDVNDDGLEVEFAKRKKIALLFVGLNGTYWSYAAQVIKDCRQNFLPQHQVDYFLWTDYSEEAKTSQLAKFDSLLDECKASTAERKQGAVNDVLNAFAAIVRQYEVFFPTHVQEIMNGLGQRGIFFKREGPKYWVESSQPLTEADVFFFHEKAKLILRASHLELHEALKGVNVIETEGVEWPAPTLMRYHLFLNEEEKLRDYDYIFYMDADMRVVAKVSDEILGDGLTAAEHPMYSLSKEYIPPYEPNPESTAYVKRPGRVVDVNGVPRFKPYYYAGGFQGGAAGKFLDAMRVMKKNIDKDFDRNYIAIWNDESHWNKYLSDYDDSLIVLSPSYVYPDSLIKEYYEKIWGCSYEPKIITLTKPFTLSRAGAEEANKFINR